MSVLHRSIELLEPYDGKLSCTVLRGESTRKGADLPDLYFMIFNLCLLPVLFLIIEQLLLWRFRQEGRHEE